MSKELPTSIPIEKTKLVRDLANTLPINRKEQFSYFARLLDNFYRYKFSNELSKLKKHFHPFDPDTETPIHIKEEEEELYARDLVEKFHTFLEEQQYQRINERDIVDIFEKYKFRGLDIMVPVNQYRDLVVYFCDQSVKSKHYRKWYTLWLRKYEIKIPYYRRMAVLFRPFRHHFLSSKEMGKFHKQGGVQSSRHMVLPQEITLKLFKNIGQDYLPILFPGVPIRLGAPRKIFIAFMLCLGIAIMVTNAFVWHNPWTYLLAIIPISLIALAMFIYLRDKERYERNLLTNFYYNGLNNNTGVLNYLVDRAREANYKKTLLLLYAFWSDNSWSFHSVNVSTLHHYLHRFIVERFGIKAKIDAENIASKLCAESDAERSIFLHLIEPVYAQRSYLRTDANVGEHYLEVEFREEILPLKGKIAIAPGTPLREYHTFTREDFRFYIEGGGVKRSHPIGSFIRWIVDKPYRTKLTSESSAGSSSFHIFSGDIDHIPLCGLGRIGSNGNFEFRYYRDRESNQLHLVTGLRYRHTPGADQPVMVRLILPGFRSKIPLPKDSWEIPCAEDISFPKEGFITIGDDPQRQQYVAYELVIEEQKAVLRLATAVEEHHPEGIKISLARPQTTALEKIYRGSRLIPVADTRPFSLRGNIVVKPGSSNEERVPYQRGVVRLELQHALQFSHDKGSTIYIEQLDSRSKILQDARPGDKSLLIHGVIENTRMGNAVLSPAEKNQEKCHFKIATQYLYLMHELRRSHSKNTLVQEALFECSLRYEALQGAYFITLEDASSFPLAGKLEIHFNGSRGVKEVLPFRRSEGSNTLMLTMQTPKDFATNTPVYITAVETTTQHPIHYHDDSISVDFSFVPDFPEHGKFIIEPGTQAEEQLKFQRYPRRLYLDAALKNPHCSGSAIDFHLVPIFNLLDPILPKTKRALLEGAHILPEKGHIITVDEGTTKIFKYRKYPNRVLLSDPCRYHHSRDALVYLSEIPQNVQLRESAARGAQQLFLLNGQALPEKGVLILDGMFRTVHCQFVRNKDTLYLQNPLRYPFSTKTTLRLPELSLATHLSPGMDYLEIDDISNLPSSGTMCIEAPFRLPIGRRLREKPEKVSFRHLPDLLWLESSVDKEYPINTEMMSRDVLISGAGALQARPLEKAIEMVRQQLASAILE